MKIIISPAKRMKEWELSPPKSRPVFQREADMIARRMKGLPYEELKAVLKCKDPLAREAYERYRSMGEGAPIPALFAYDGIQYQYMASKVLEDEQYRYLQKHLRILSALYGVLKPMDGIYPYRLEMQARVSVDNCRNLYEFWGKRLWEHLYEDGDTVLDLASEEYGKAIGRYVEKGQRFVTCRFLERSGERLVEKGVHVKMARGSMVRFLAEEGAEGPETAKRFSELGFSFKRELSGEDCYVFLREE